MGLGFFVVVFVLVYRNLLELKVDLFSEHPSSCLSLVNWMIATVINVLEIFKVTGLPV